MKKYGKPFKDVASVNKYIEQQDILLKEQIRVDEVYKNQPKRTNCKICLSNMPENTSLTRSDIGYTLCKNCGHLNGFYEDSMAFCQDVYCDNQETYVRKFVEEDFIQYKKRVKNIYLPKVKFLFEALEEEGLNAVNLSYTDFGCGAGQLLSALQNSGATKIEGFEVSKTQVDFANANLGKPIVSTFNITKTKDLIENIKNEVVSMIGVLEHLEKPNEILQSLKNNKNVQYLYFSVPMLSICVLFQKLFKDTYERQLASAHTHIFTKESISYICKKYGFKEIAQWWFGTDFLDLYRGMAVAFNKNNNEEINLLDNYLLSILDELQMVIDKNELSSEIHMLVKLR